MELKTFEHEAGWIPPYPVEGWKRTEDDGTMLENVQALEDQVVGHRIVDVTLTEVPGYPDLSERMKELGFNPMVKTITLTLDSGKVVELVDTEDCCAYTELEEFLTHVDMVNHVILGVGTTDEYTTWHIYADFGDIMTMRVGWSCGNPFFYAYGFDIRVKEVEDAK